MGTTKPTDYWQRYSGNLNKSKQKPTPGKERNTGEVEKLFALETMDLDQTVRVNGERHVEFVLRSKQPVEQ